METELTLKALKESDAHQQRAGFLPADVAAYPGKDGERYVALWRRGERGEKAVLYAGVPAAKHSAETDSLKERGYVPQRLQGLLGTDGAVRYCGVWWEGPSKPEVWNLVWDDFGPGHAGRVASSESLLLDVHVGAAAPAPPLRQMLEADLARVTETLRARPDDIGSHHYQGVVLFHLGRDREAQEAFATFFAKSKAFWGHGYTALLQARAGKARQARRDLAAFARAGGDRILVLATTTLVDVYLGEAGRALPALERELEGNPRDARLIYHAGWVYSQAARISQARQAAWCAGLTAAPLSWASLAVAPRPARAAQYAQRALALLDRAIASGYRDFSNLLINPDLAPLHGLPGYRDLLARHGMRRRYGSVWQDDPSREAVGLHGLAPEAHLARCRELIGQGWRPAALSLTVVPGERFPVAASVWHRKVLAEPRQEQAARRQATAAATLLCLNEPQRVWPLFRHSPDPTVRNYLVQRAGLLGVDPRLLIRRLEVETDTSARAALILALGEYAEKDLPASVRKPLTDVLLGWYRDDPDAGIHGAIDWLLRHDQEGPAPRLLGWGQAKHLERIDEERKRRDPDGKRGWYVNQQGQTLVLVEGPVEFRMGSPHSEAERLGQERPHLRRIGRSFAIASKPVTVEQWGRFLQDRPDVPRHFVKRYSPEQEGPIVGVSWYAAAQYCNWLSAREGIPREQWCYPDEIKEGMKLFPDYLRRTGYRLPTEAEWELACRAGTTSSRYFGSSTELLPRYGLFHANSQDRAWSVGQKRPNDLGLFDMQGNVWTWCQDRFLNYPPSSPGSPIDDLEDGADVSENVNRILRGASFGNHSPSVRSAHRYSERPSHRYIGVGLRTARTCP
jgi:formylglycine-generating enzyme required for sulfatase activity